MIDVKLVVLTVISIINRPAALAAVNTLLTGIGADEDVVRVSLRRSVLVPSAPPGSDKIVPARQRLPA